MKVYVLHVEGNTDFYSDVVSVHRTFEGATRALKAEAAAARGEGEVVEDGEDDDMAEDDDWTRSFTIHPMEVRD